MALWHEAGVEDTPNLPRPELISAGYWEVSLLTHCEFIQQMITATPPGRT